MFFCFALFSVGWFRFVCLGLLNVFVFRVLFLLLVLLMLCLCVVELLDDGVVCYFVLRV